MYRARRKNILSTIIWHLPSSFIETCKLNLLESWALRLSRSGNYLYALIVLSIFPFFVFHICRGRGFVHSVALLIAYLFLVVSGDFSNGLCAVLNTSLMVNGMSKRLV